MEFTQAVLRDLIGKAAIPVLEKGRLYALVNMNFSTAEQILVGGASSRGCCGPAGIPELACR